MNVTGGNFPATPVQQTKLDEWQRWFVAVDAQHRSDQNGNMAIGYSTSSATQEPSIRYAGRLASIR